MKTYKIVVSFGDGLPKESTIEAKNGQLAQDLGFQKFPAARHVRVVGVIFERLPEPVIDLTPHPLFQEVLVPEVSYGSKFLVKRGPKGKIINKEELFNEALKMRELGISYERISMKLGIGKSTVRNWISEHVENWH